MALSERRGHLERHSDLLFVKASTGNRASASSPAARCCAGPGGPPARSATPRPRRPTGAVPLRRHRLRRGGRGRLGADAGGPRARPGRPPRARPGPAGGGGRPGGPAPGPGGRARIGDALAAAVNLLNPESNTMSRSTPSPASFGHGAIDDVISLHTIYHLPPAEQAPAIDELVRVTRPGGKAVVVYVWNHSAAMAVVFGIRGFLGRLRRLGRAPQFPDTRRAAEEGARALYFQPQSHAWFVRKSLAGIPRSSASGAPSAEHSRSGSSPRGGWDVW